MNQLPIFVNLRSKKVVLVGEGEAAEAKRRLIERAGGSCVNMDDPTAVLAFIATDDFHDVAAKLRARGLLVNVVDQPDHCDFTTPAIVDRDPVIVAIGTGGASAGLAKALRQRFEAMLPHRLGMLATQLSAARDRLRARWPDGAARRKAIDDALAEAGMIDPLADQDERAITAWLDAPDNQSKGGLISILLGSTDPDDLTLKQARLLGQADHIYHAADVAPAILNRARADAARHLGMPPATLPSGLVLHLQLQMGDR
jgi:uroporphyrin-III C-methyltransferase / precorrin-2 dehydrogenase / sirohydrochlorin ferrochelatase